MTTAHRPTFDPVSICIPLAAAIAVTPADLPFPGSRKRSSPGSSLPPASSSRLYTTKIPVRNQGISLSIAREPQLITSASSQRGQGGAADRETRDLRAELLAAEQAHFAKAKGALTDGDAENNAPESTYATKRPLELTSHADSDEDPEAKRRRILEETRDIDADESDEEEDDDDDDDDSDDDSDDDEAELKRELERIKRERIEKREKEVSSCSWEDCLRLRPYADGAVRNESALQLNKKLERKILRWGIPC